MTVLAAGLVGKRLMYRDLVADNATGFGCSCVGAAVSGARDAAVRGPDPRAWRCRSWGASACYSSWKALGSLSSFAFAQLTNHQQSTARPTAKRDMTIPDPVGPSSGAAWRCQSMSWTAAWRLERERHWPPNLLGWLNSPNPLYSHCRSLVERRISGYSVYAFAVNRTEELQVVPVEQRSSSSLRPLQRIGADFGRVVKSVV